MREPRASSGDSERFQARIESLIFINDKWDGCMHGQGIVSGRALMPPVGFRFLEDFADPNFEHCGCDVVRRFTPIVTDERVSHLLVQ